MAAGFVAASMARRSQTNYKNLERVFVPTASQATSKGGVGVFLAR
jgi:hypothetical protein